MTIPDKARRVRLCLNDFFHQDVVEMIERETRKYELWSIESSDHPDFRATFDLLWSAFGPVGEMEREEVIRSYLATNNYEPVASGTFIRYFLMVAKDTDGNIRGARDGCVLVNPAYANDLCVVYLSHIFMTPEARGTVLSYALRIAPVEVAVQYLVDLAALGKITLPNPAAPGKNFGMRIDLAAEMEYFAPEDRISWQRLLFYGRGGFDAINPRHFPYRQPDFRDPELIRQTGNQPVPFMMLLRRLRRERQATLPLEEARAVMRLIYDHFATHCSPDFLANSLQHVLDRLEERSKVRDYVELLPLPTGAKDIKRLTRLFRYRVFRRYYKGDHATQQYLQSGIREVVRQNPHYLKEQLALIAAELEKRPSFVYPNRDKAFTWDGLADASPPEPPAEVAERPQRRRRFQRRKENERRRKRGSPTPSQGGGANG